MSANDGIAETELVDAAVAWLRERLPSRWQVERSNRALEEPESQDAAIDILGPDGTRTTLAVDARRSFTPRDVDRLLPRLTRLIRSLAGNVPVLVVAPWLSRRAQDMLADEGINFIDLTGNALVRLEYPAVYIRTPGATRNPEPAPRGRAGVRGPKAARLVRLLVDIRPPYGVRQLAAASGLTPGYVSRLLDALDREALIERTRQGQVVSVEVSGLLRRWADTYDVLKANDARPFLARAGAAQALAGLAGTRMAERIAVTGSFGAVRFSPVAAPVLLLAYCDEATSIVHELDLLPADEGANVVLLRPFDPVVWERTIESDGVVYAAASQIAIDCLTGPGRMPAEGEALLRWMGDNESMWRRLSLGEAGASRLRT
jgi:DNA-binding transcriptional ArsR family regulator